MDECAGKRIAEEHARWAKRADASLQEGLARLADEPARMREAFRADLAFGTAGLRGKIGPGTNAMNIHTVGKATQGLAAYLNGRFDAPAVAIARDSRIMGDAFVRRAAEVLAANGVVAYVYPRIEPTPALSYAVRDLRCQAGICVTASHNRAEDNGYKVYGEDGCQITDAAAQAIEAAIAAVDVFDGVRTMPFDHAVEAGLIRFIGDDTLDRFVADVEALSPDRPLDAYGVSLGDDDLSLVYTPLHGAGLECIGRVFDDIGLKRVRVVEEQAVPDGSFPTCPYPNPETPEALRMGVALCEETGADLLIASDPDADRIGVAVNCGGTCRRLTGNEVGALLIDYLCAREEEAGRSLGKRVVVTTVVSSMLVDELARRYGFELRRTLTGFKYIGEQIALLEEAGEAGRFLFGFEESLGYLSGTHVRDKDAVNAAMLICQMARWHKAHGRTLVDAIEALYERFGYRLDKTRSYALNGPDPFATKADVMRRLREAAPSRVAGFAVEGVVDYLDGGEMPVQSVAGGGRSGADGAFAGAHEAGTLPPSDVIEYRLEGAGKLIIRPSGTEAKVKAYIHATAATRDGAEKAVRAIEAWVEAILG